MPSKTSKSQDRNWKRVQKGNPSEKQKIKEKDLEYQRAKLNAETEQTKKYRVSAYMKEKRESEKNETVEEKRHRLRLKRGIEMNEGKEATWILKSIMEMTPDEKKSIT